MAKASNIAEEERRERIARSLDFYKQLSNQNLTTMPRTISSGANLFKFDTVGKVFIGSYTGQNKVWENDSDEAGREHKKGDIIGYEFEDEKGEFHLVGASYSIEKAMEQIGTGDYARITFLGQVKAKVGNVNRFKVEVFDLDLKEDRDELRGLGFDIPSHGEATPRPDFVEPKN